MPIRSFIRSGTGIKKEYLLKNGVINTELIGGITTPVGSLTSEGIRINIGGGNYTYDFRTVKPYYLEVGDIIIYEIEGTFGLAFTIATFSHAFGSGGIGIVGTWCLSGTVYQTNNRLETQDLFRLMSGYSGNHCNISIKSIYIVRKISGGVAKKLFSILRGLVGGVSNAFN